MQLCYIKVRCQKSCAFYTRLGWDLKTDVTGSSIEDVVQKAVDLTGMTDVLVEDRSVLLPDNGAGYISQQLNEYSRLVGIRHIIFR